MHYMHECKLRFINSDKTHTQYTANEKHRRVLSIVYEYAQLCRDACASEATATWRFINFVGLLYATENGNLSLAAVYVQKLINILIDFMFCIK